MSTLPRRLTSDSDFAGRRKRYDLNRRYYHGEDDRLPAIRRQIAARNMASVMVDTIVDHMGSARLDFGAELLDHEAELHTSIDGDGAFKVTWDARTPASASPAPGQTARRSQSTWRRR